MHNTDFSRIAGEILQWAVQRDFRGTDPFDGLNSRLLAPLLKRSRFLRLATIQAVKRSPFNLRPILGVPEGYNPKGLALFLSGLGISKGRGKACDTSPCTRLEQMILSLASGPDGAPAFSEDRRIRTDITPEEAEQAGVIAWGYNFPWQSRAFLQPAWYPTAVCSSFILDALRDSQSGFYPVVARKLASFINDSLNIHEDGGGVCFSYSPRDNTRVYNASLFAAKILVQAAQFVEEPLGARFEELAVEACRYVAGRQRSNGSWVYGEADHWQWVDNLHTGFVLETMQFISEAVGTDDFGESLHRGLNYYMNGLFTKDGDAKYLDDSLYPLDPHCYAQGAITMIRMNEPVLAERILSRAIEQIWDEKGKGFFRKYGRHSRDGLIHLRWNQGWMFRALQECNRQDDDEDLV